MALVNVGIGANTLKVGLPTELDIKRLLCALLAGDINNLLKGPLVCINIAIEDLLGQLPSSALTDALRNLQNGVGDLLQQSGINDTLGRLNSATAQLESLFGLGGICPVPFTLPRIGNILGDMVNAYSAAARGIIQDIADLEQALSNICLGTGGIGANWNNMVGGSLKRLKTDIDNFGTNLPGNVIAQYTAQLNQSKTAIGGIINRMSGGGGNDATRVAAAAGLAFQLNGLYDRIGSYPVTDGNIVYDNVFKMFLDPDVYDALIAVQGGSSLITQEQPVLDNCGRVISTKTVVLQGDIAAAPFDATIDATTVPIPAPALGDFKFREQDGSFKVNLLSGNNPKVTLIKGRSYNIALETENIGVNILYPNNNQFYSEGLFHEDGTSGNSAQNKKSGFLTWNIPIDAPDELKYQDVGGTQTGTIKLQNVSVAGIPLPPDPSGVNSFGRLTVTGGSPIEAGQPGDTLALSAGNNITFVTDPVNKILTINSTGGGGGGGGGGDTFKTIRVGTTDVVADSGEDVLTLAAGSNIVLAADPATDTITISSTGTSSNSFNNFVVDTTTITPDQPDDTLTFVAGRGVALTGNATSDQITIANALEFLAGPGINIARDDITNTVTITNIGGGGGGGGNNFAIVAVPGQSNIVAETANDTLTIAAGSNVTITTDSATDTLTIAAIAASQPTFRNVIVGATTVVADGPEDTLTLVAGPNVTLTANAATDTITIDSTAASDTFKTVKVGATDVVADSPNDTLNIVAGNGIQITANATTDTITIASLTSGNTAFVQFDVAGQNSVVADNASDVVTFEAGAAITLTTDAATDKITFAVTDNPIIPGTQYMRVPRGATTARPASPQNGMLRYNTTTTAFEVYYNTIWKSLIDEVVSVGTGTNVIKSVTDAKVEIRSIKAGTGISVTTDGDDITITSTAAGSITGINVGTGTGVFKEKTGDQLIFRSIKAGTGVSVTTDGNDITISSPRDQYVEAGTATTTDAAFTNIVWSNTLAPANNSSWFFEATFIGRRTGGVVERNAFKLEGVLDNTSGVISLVGPAAKTTYQNNATQWDVDVSITSNQVRFRVKGEVGKTLKWTGWLRYQQVTEV